MSRYDDEDWQDWLNDLMENAPEHYDGDEAMEAIATRYVRDLEAVAAAALEWRDSLAFRPRDCSIKLWDALTALAPEGENPT